MKLVVIPFTEDEGFCCPPHSFKADWCLDLFGYINTQNELQDLLKQINEYTKPYPLLSERAKKRLTYFLAGIFTFITLLLVLVMFSLLPHNHIPPQRLLSYDAVTAVALVLGRMITDFIAKRRAAAFDKAMRPLLDQINAKAYPTANWKLVWRQELTHISIKTKKNGRSAKATPKYAEHADIVIEIHDGLATRTAHVIHVKFPPVPPNSQMVNISVV